ncbi:hypothetical protein BDY17DRAFT_310367 [Neohortaea acidophila]|uniref:Uncharacterized protein n=1 Tax=Neohortaea acidophila TaxID=245834 RepID=A0A6A6PT99_9PEZI|nr:uncharacterized protein BDY17DRAFT_310367 [Neohortaea acidophila]KAF2483338.1 hypothetical protein BDY17DRAFT_310367 [Neohortaea acidophila]
MQSSPPQRAWEPPSPTTSKYSLDLAALEADSRSGASTPLPTQQVDKILSEDIDGPSDFTQNLEMYMRGATWTKETDMDNKQDAGQESTRDDGDLHESSSTLNGEDEKTTSHHTPSNSPPKDSAFNDVEAQDAAAEDTSSDWDPYGEAQTPQPQPKHGFLQPTVEDYYSELVTPDALKSMRVRNESPSHDSKPSGAPGMRQSSGRASSPTLSPERSPVMERRPTSAHNAEDGLAKQLQELRSKYTTLEQLNATLSSNVEQERRMREEANADYEARLADAARRERDLTEMKTQSHQHKEDFRREFAKLKERVQKHESTQSAHEQQMSVLRKEHAIEMQNLRDELERVKNEHEQDLQATEQEVELERRSREDAEESARADREALEKLNARIEKMHADMQQGEELREQIKEKLRVVTMDNEMLRAPRQVEERAKAAEERAKVQEQVINKLQGRVGELKGQLHAEKVANQSASLRAAPPSKVLQAEVNTLRAKVNELTIERDELQDNFGAADTERKQARKKLAGLQEMQEAIDSKFATAWDSREVMWKEKWDAWQKERRLMAKVIMRQWGREEMGPPDENGRQPYRYKYGGPARKKQTTQATQEAK